MFVELASNKDKLDTGLNAARAQITEFSTKANSLLGTLGIGLSAVGAAKFLTDTADKGSHLIETMSKLKEVFRGSSGIVSAMAEDMATKFGNVKSETLDAAAAFGLIAQGVGMTERASASLSVSLVRLADDAASFYNKPFDVALQKIRSGLVGEAEPLREFGIMLSEDAVKSRALADGAKTVNGELTEQEKVMTRVKLITEGLAKATGDHGRTLDQYANQLKLVRGQAENFQANIGTGLSAAWAQAMVDVENKGVMAGIGGLMKNVSAGMRGEGSFQGGADVGLGVERGLPAFKAPPNPFLAQLNAAKLQAEKEFFMSKPFEDRTGVAGLMANLGAFGAFGGQPGIAGNLNRAYMREDLNKQIAVQQKGVNAWGGGHVMDTESFMRSAQEKILAPQDETAKQQLAELIKARENLDKLVGRQEGKATVKGMVLRGRES